MSSNAQKYTLVLDIDDSKLKSKLSAFGGMFGSSGKSSQKSGSNSKMMMDLGKLGIIAGATTGTVLGVNKLVSIMSKSSPILGTMLKIINTSITFILRPIGDFIGMILRPFVVYLLRNIAIPMYKEWSPIMRSLGSWIGAISFKPIENMLDFIFKDRDKRGEQIGKEHDAKIAQNVALMTNFTENLRVSFSKLSADDILKSIVNIRVAIDKKIAQVLTGAGEFLSSRINLKGIDVAVDLWRGNLLKNLGDIGRIFNGLSINALTQSLTNSWNSLVLWFDGMSERISAVFSVDLITTVLQEMWDSITGFFKSIRDFFSDTIGSIFSLITGGGGNNNNNNNSSPAQTQSVNVNFYDTIIDNATEGLENFTNELSSMFNNAWNGRK